MNVYFTICSNNYLSFAMVLYRSLKAYQPASRFVLFLCDEPVSGLNYEAASDEMVVLSTIEPRFNELAAKYNIVELNTCLKPAAFEYLFAQQHLQAVYLDPDICVFSSLASVEEAFDSAAILLTPHIYTPIPFDGKSPQESSFLNFGLYNLGFIGLKKTAETISFLSWWKNWTYEKGYIDVYNGIFVDQLPLNHAPVFYKEVSVLHDAGLNMAPWNLHERRLVLKDGNFLVNGSAPLKFYHFSSFNMREPELPIEKYDRFHMSDRPDLLPLYEHYKQELIAAGYTQSYPVRNAYEGMRNAFIKERKKQKWKRRILFWKKRKRSNN